MATDHFLQAAACFTLVVPRRFSVSPPRGGIRACPNASSKGGDWRPTKAEVPSPEVTLPGPFATAPSPDLPVAPPWLLTPAAFGRSSSKGF